MSQSKKKHYKKRKPAAHIQPKKNVTNPNQKTAKELSKTEKFLEDWTWLLTLIAIIVIGVLLVILWPKIDSCQACNNCGKKAEQVEDNIEQEITSAVDAVTSAADAGVNEIVSAAEAALTTTTTTTTTEATTTTTSAPAAALDLSNFNPSEYTYQFNKPANGEEIAVFDTSMGKIKMRLFPDAAPKSVENFKKHISDGYYNGTTFHRVINNFMIQGGDPQGTGSGGESIWGGTFEDEYENGLYNFRGALSMANTGEPDSNGSQFFIVQCKNLEGDLSNDGLEVYKTYLPEWAAKTYFKLGGYPMGDHEFYEGTHYNGHTVFGQVFEGMDVVDAIAAVEVTDASAQNYKPVKDVTINKAYLEKYQG